MGSLTTCSSARRSKGSRKSYIGRPLERSLGVLFFDVEPLWFEHYAACKASGPQPSISEGSSKVCPQIVEALRTNENVCVETAGASPEILNDLLSLAAPSETLVVRLSTPLELCLVRIATRDQTNQVPMDAESVRNVYAVSVADHVALR